MKYFIYQLKKNDCGIASLKIIMANLSNDKNYLYAPLGEDYDKQYSLLELKEIGKSFNLFLTGYLVKNIEELNNEKRYYILILRLSNGGKHSVVIKKISKHFAYLFNPSIGKKIIYLKKYLRKINVCEILVAENNQIEKCSYRIEPLINSKDKIKIYTFEILAILFYLISAYFVDKESHFLFPIIFLVLGVLFSIIYKINTYNLMKNIDDRYISITYDDDFQKKKENYTLLHNVKSNILLTNTNLIINLASTIGLNLILILQETYSIFVFLSSAIILLVDQIVFENKIKNKNNELEILENHLFYEVNRDEYLSKYDEIKSKTYRLAKLISLKKIIYIFLLLIIVLFMSAITNNANINFVLFYLAMSLFTFTNLENVITILNKNKESIINEAKFYYLLNKNNNPLEKIKK